MRRRDFLKTAAYSTAAIALNSSIPQAKENAMSPESKSGNSAKLPQRQYGQKDIWLSIIGFGGIVVMNEEQDRANRLVAEAVERGVNYFDVAPTYGDAEVKLGPALEPYRKNSFLACKTTQRQRDAAEAEFQQSLERLRTDYFDLYQLHAINDVNQDVDAAFSKGGVMELLIEAKKTGQIHYLGFSAHSVDAALAAMDRYDFDSILFPVSFATYYEGNFGPTVIQTAVEKGVAILALKALARQSWPENHPDRQKYGKCWYQPLTDPGEAELGLRFTLNQPVTAAIPPGEKELFDLAIELAMNLKPFTAEDEIRLKSLAADLQPIFRAA